MGKLNQDKVQRFLIRRIRQIILERGAEDLWSGKYAIALDTSLNPEVLSPDTFGDDDYEKYPVILDLAELDAIEGIRKLPKSYLENEDSITEEIVNGALQALEEAAKDIKVASAPSKQKDLLAGLSPLTVGLAVFAAFLVSGIFYLIFDVPPLQKNWADPYGKEIESEENFPSLAEITAMYNQQLPLTTSKTAVLQRVMETSESFEFFITIKVDSADSSQGAINGILGDQFKVGRDRVCSSHVLRPHLKQGTLARIHFADTNNKEFKVFTFNWEECRKVPLDTEFE